VLAIVGEWMEAERPRKKGKYIFELHVTSITILWADLAVISD